jgi:threonine/homoserine/homoserine lactone efflux protein
MEFAVFLLKGISLSGVLAPGPITAATIAAGTRRRHAGMRIALGHAVVEFPLMIVLLAGMSVWFENPTVQIVIGFLGGAVLVWMGVGLLRSLGRTNETGNPYAAASPLWIGLVLSAGNPYFLLWWATVGLALATDAAAFGILAFAIFAAVHWTCDLVWLEVLTIASHKGRSVFGHRTQRVVLAVCGVAMLLFGASFLYDAGADAVAREPKPLDVAAQPTHTGSLRPKGDRHDGMQARR